MVLIIVGEPNFIVGQRLSSQVIWQHLRVCPAVMDNVIFPCQLVLISLAGWLNRHQQAVIDYIKEENRILKEQLRVK